MSGFLKKFTAKTKEIVLEADEIKEIEGLAAALDLQIVRGWEKEMK